MARLTIKFGSKVVRTLDLDVKELVVGRGSDCQLELDHDLVSRRHCKVRLVGDGFVVEDLGSTTGTFVNKEKAQAHILQPGDEIVAIAEGLMAREAAMIAAVRAGLPVGQVMAGNYERMLEDGK